LKKCVVREREGGGPQGQRNYEKGARGKGKLNLKNTEERGPIGFLITKESHHGAKKKRRKTNLHDYLPYAE